MVGLTGQVETVRGVTGEPTLVQCAKAPIEFEGRTFEKVVAVANGKLSAIKCCSQCP